MLSWLLTSLGQAYAYQDRFALAQACLTEALDIRRRTGDRAGEAAALNTMGIVAAFQLHFEESLDYMRSALAIVSDDGQPQLTGSFLQNISEALRNLERYDEALDHSTRALVIRQEIGDKHAEGITENEIAATYLALGRYEESLEHYQRAWAALQGSSRDNLDHAEALYGMGTALDRLGRGDEAQQTWQVAIPILDLLGDPRAAELRGCLNGSSGSRESEASR